MAGSGSTPIYGIPFLVGGDAPDIPDLGEDGFTAIETILARLDLPPDVQTFTASGTWTKPTSADYCWIRGVAPGGSGGGAALTAAGQWSFGDGGGSGEYFEWWGPASLLPASVAVTIGAAGVGASGAMGTSGGSIAFAGLLTANGGGAGSFRSAGTANITPDTSQRTGGSGGAGTLTAQIRGKGDDGRIGIGISTAGAIGGDGGRSPWAGGGRGGVNGAGGNAVGFGAGGGGAGNLPSQAARAGGNGGGGCLVVWTFF